MNRSELIAKGRIWQITNERDKETILHEGTKTNCLSWLVSSGMMGLYKAGKIRLGKVIWEAEQPDPLEGIKKAIDVITNEAKPFYIDPREAVHKAYNPDE